MTSEPSTSTTESAEVFNDSCPFLNLHHNVRLDILKQLEFKDFVNLARTCRKWYQTAQSAPNSIKHDVKVETIRLDRNGLALVYYNNYRVRLCPADKFTFINKIKCNEMQVDNYWNERHRYTLMELLHYMKRHIEHFQISTLRVFVKPFEPDGYAALERIMDSIPNIIFYATEEISTSLSIWFNEQNFFDKHFSQSRIDLTACSIHPDTVNLVLKQWVEKKRPNLTFLSSRLQVPNRFLSLEQRLEDQFQHITKDIQDFVINKSTLLGGLFWKVARPEMPVLRISLDRTNVVIRRVNT